MNKNAQTRVLNARAQMILRHPFFGCLILRLKMVEANDIPTMATNGKQLFYNAEFVCSMTEAELIFVLVHEVLHCAYLHFDRVGTRNLGEFNVSTDYAINRDIIKQGIGKMPEGMLHDTKYGPELSAEEIHHMLYGNKPKSEPEKGEEQEPEKNKLTSNHRITRHREHQKASKVTMPDRMTPARKAMTDRKATSRARRRGQGEGSGAGEGQGQGQGQGSGSGNGTSLPQGGNGQEPGNGDSSQGSTPSSVDPRTQGGMAGFFPDPNQSPAEKEELAQDWQMAVKQAYAVAKAQGNDVGEFARIIEKLNHPVQDWRAILREFIEASTTKAETWKRPSTRFASSGLHMPGKRSDGINKLVCVIDTSGSIDMECLSQFITELNEAFEIGIIDNLVVLYNDVSVYLTEEYVSGEIIDTSNTKFRTGGTNFFDAMRIIGEDHTDAAGVLFFTDLIVSEYGIDPLIPVLWAVWGTDYSYDRFAPQVPFGTAMHVTPDN
jgi:predicted metal-dependent peptidase